MKSTVIKNTGSMSVFFINKKISVAIIVYESRFKHVFTFFLPFDDLKNKV